MTTAPLGIPLDSPAVGTDLGPTPCGSRLDAAEPAASAPGPTLGLTFSGGGFRATLAAVGMLRFLSDADLLGKVRYVSSVSGGSIANGLLALAWPRLREAGHTTAPLEAELIDPVVSRLSHRSLKRALVLNAPRLIGPKNRTDLLGDLLDSWFFGGVQLEQLDPQVRWIVNAANMTTGVRFAFERDLLGDYVSGRVPTAGSGVRLAQAVAASAAVPGAFAAWTVKGLQFPCASTAPKLLDGGVYDNTGLQALDKDHDDVFTVTMNAGGLLRGGAYGRIPIVRDLSRANALLYRQSTALRTNMMVTAFRRSKGLPISSPLPVGARRGVLVNLGTVFDEQGSPSLNAWRARFPEERAWCGRDLALYPTVFNRMPEELCRRLIYRGWWLIGAAFSDYYPELVPAPEAISPPPLG
jgi:NTE family protein